MAWPSLWIQETKKWREQRRHNQNNSIGPNLPVIKTAVSWYTPQPDTAADNLFAHRASLNPSPWPSPQPSKIMFSWNKICQACTNPNAELSLNRSVHGCMARGHTNILQRMDTNNQLKGPLMCENARSICWFGENIYNVQGLCLLRWAEGTNKFKTPSAAHVRASGPGWHPCRIPPSAS